MFKPWFVAKVTVTVPDPFLVVNALVRVDATLIE